MTTASCAIGSSGLAESTLIGSARLRTPTPLPATSGMRLRVSRTVRPSRSRVCTTITSRDRRTRDRMQTGPLGRGPRLLVDVDSIAADPSCGERVDLPFQVLLRGRHPRISQFHAENISEVVSVQQE